MAEKKILFRNKEEGLRIVYDEAGEKREVVPGGTLYLTPKWGGRYRCLERADKPVAKTTATAKKKTKPEKDEESE